MTDASGSGKVPPIGTSITATTITITVTITVSRHRGSGGVAPLQRARRCLEADTHRGGGAMPHRSGASIIASLTTYTEYCDRVDGRAWLGQPTTESVRAIFASDSM